MARRFRSQLVLLNKQKENVQSLDDFQVGEGPHRARETHPFSARRPLSAATPPGGDTPTTPRGRRRPTHEDARRRQPRRGGGVEAGWRGGGVEGRGGGGGVEGGRWGGGVEGRGGAVV